MSGGGGVSGGAMIGRRGVIIGDGRRGGERYGSEVFRWGWRGGCGGAAVVGLFAAGLFGGAGAWERGG